MKRAKQVAAIPMRRGPSGALEVLLVTSRDTGRWVVPKGWTSKKLKDRKAALREAEEEAGVTGKISVKPIGTFTYLKRGEATFSRVAVLAFVLWVTEEQDVWPEAEERKRKWVSPRIAAKLVQEPQLSALIRGLGRTPPHIPTQKGRKRT